MVKRRRLPNILVTGTPGTGKTTTSSLLAEAIRFRHINVSEMAKQKGLHHGYDDKTDSYIIDDDLVCDELEGLMEDGGNVVDYHGCDIFPERWFDSVVVLQTEMTILFDRLSQRGYSEEKRRGNMECEIFQVLLEEAREGYREDIVVALSSDSSDELEANVESLAAWAMAWSPSPPPT